MPLKIELKPGERLIIGNALITNDADRARIFIEGDVPILREKYVLTRNEATTPCKKVYYIIQEMYLDREPLKFHAIPLAIFKNSMYSAGNAGTSISCKS